jgi:hypothetical protein
LPRENLSENVATVDLSAAVTAYGPSTIDPSTHRIEQIVLWMDVVQPADDPEAPARIARQDKGGSMALKQVDGRSSWSAHVNLRT